MAAGSERAATADVVWLPDDTEESVVGTSLHQQAIGAIFATLEQVRLEQSETWGAGNQMRVEGLTRRDGTLYTPMPDILVHPHPIAPDVPTITLAVDGPPWLVIEVASRSTVAADVGEKGATYARAGVQEYLVFDPTAHLLDRRGTQVRAWRLQGTGFTPWQPTADGLWHSTSIGVSFQPQGVLLGIYDRHGVFMPPYSQERRRRLAAERRAADVERRAADVERHAADVEQRAADVEQRATDAQRRIAELEAELRRLRGEDA